MIEFEGIKYTIINHGRRYVSTGTLSETTESNAIPPGYGPELIIPEQIHDEKNQYYIVVEIGIYSFFRENNIKSVFIPSTVRTIRSKGLYQLTECESLVFGQNSMLSVIEVMGIYDFLKLKELVFTGNCLTRLGGMSLGYMFLVENLILLSSIKRVDAGALVGMKSLKNLYVSEKCSKFAY